MKSLLQRTIFIGFSLFCFSASAHWTLVEGESNLNFVSTKNLHTSEIQQFRKLKGEFAHEGKLQIEIDLASIDSGIDIRDTRIRDNLFLVNELSVARLTAQLPDKVLKLAIGSSVLVTLPAKLKLMGISKTFNVTVQVTRNFDNGMVATSTQPILLSAADFGLDSGIEILRDIAGLNSIGQTVPVNFNLVFVKL